MRKFGWLKMNDKNWMAKIEIQKLNGKNLQWQNSSGWKGGGGTIGQNW